MAVEHKEIILLAPNKKQNKITSILCICCDKKCLICVCVYIYIKCQLCVTNHWAKGCDEWENYTYREKVFNQTRGLQSNWHLNGHLKNDIGVSDN